MSEHVNPPDEPENKAPVLAKSRRRWCWLLLLPLLVCGLFAWLSATSAGFVYFWQAVSVVSGGALKVGQVNGTLWQGFQARAIVLERQDETIQLDSLQLAWQPRDLWQRELHITRLDLGLIQLKPKPQAHSASVMSLPRDLKLPLPLAVRIDALNIAAIRQHDALIAYDLRGAYSYAKTHHQLTLSTARLAAGVSLSGQLGLAAQAPFAVSGLLTAEAPQGNAKLQLGGTLSALQVKGGVTLALMQATLQARLRPFAAQPWQHIQQLELIAQGVNPHALTASLPQAAIDLKIQIHPDAINGATGILQLENRLAGSLAAGRLPIAGLNGQFKLNDQALDLTRLQAQLLQGSLSLKGQLTPQKLGLTAQLNAIALRQFLPSLPDQTLNGLLSLAGPIHAPRLRGALHGSDLALQADMQLEQHASRLWSLTLNQLAISSRASRLALSGQLDTAQRFKLHGQLTHVNPAAFQPQWPQGDINAQIQAEGQLATLLSLALQLELAPSQLSRAPLSGMLHARVQGQQLTALQANLNLAGNTLQAQGAWGKPGDALQAKLDAPNLGRLGLGLAGQAHGWLALSGPVKSPQIKAGLTAQALRLPGAVNVKAVTLNADVSASDSGVLKLALNAKGVNGQGWALDQLALQADGLRRDQRVQLAASGTAQGQHYQLQLRAEGGMLASSSGWRGKVLAASLQGVPSVTLLAPLSVELDGGRLQLGAGHFNVAGAKLVFDQLQRQASGAWVSSGHISGLQLDKLKPLMSWPYLKALTVSAQWQLLSGNSGSFKLMRERGDVQIDSDTGMTPLGLSQAMLSARWHGGQTQVDAQLAMHAGQARLNGTLFATPLQLSAQTPMSGQLSFDFNHLAELAQAIGAEAAGELSGKFDVSGLLTQPAAQGTIRGRALMWRDAKTGIQLSGGILDARLDGQKLMLQQLRFTSGQGQAVASGTLDLKNARPNASIRVDVNQFSVFDRADRLLIVSGQTFLNLNQQLLQLTGQLRVDQGRISLPEASTPALSDDVVIIGRPEPSSSFASLPIKVDLALDLGHRFVFTGPGLSMQLAGKVRVSAHPGTAPSAVGQVKLLRGRYKAYGQDLDIDRGTITFAGPLDNPALNVRARRRLSPVGAGVEVTGSVAAPVLRLIADETMDDRNKLSWLVLGHEADDSSQDSGFLAMAASSFAADSLNQKLGLFDDVGLTHKQSKTALNGTVSPAEQVVTVGKQLTRTLYLGYEYGMTSSQQALKVIYRLRGRWSILLRIGDNASAETRYTLRFD